MKKRIICFALVLTMLSSTLALFSCGGENEPEDVGTTRMTVDINPSVEFMIDDTNKVVSVTALNDDGSILIAGEAFIGKTPEEATELMVSLAADTGYLVKGNVTSDENTVKISVSGDTDYAEQLAASVETKAAAVLEELDIEGNVEKVAALGLEALRELVLSTSVYTKAEIEAMEEAQLYDVIAEARVETANLLTEEMREVYYAAKEHKISFAESEETAKIIKELGGLYTITYTAYNTALSAYSEAISALDELRYNTLISPDSEYQKALTALREAKVDLLTKKSYTASLDINGTEYAAATVTLQLSEENYDSALAACEAIGEQANAAFESLIMALEQSETALRELENTMFDANIEETLKTKAVDIENSLNQAKDSFFEEFETAHAADISAIEASLIARKQELKAAIAD